MDYQNLTSEVRFIMGYEIETDAMHGKLYISPRLSPNGQVLWPKLLEVAARVNDDNWLIERISPYILPKVNGRKTPYNAAQTLAESEFNRYYMRALAIQAIAEEKSLEIYEAKQVRELPPEQAEMIGQQVDPQELLEDLRASVGITPRLKLPPNPNAGLSVRLVVK